MLSAARPLPLIVLAILIYAFTSTTFRNLGRENFHRNTNDDLREWQQASRQRPEYEPTTAESFTARPPATHTTATAGTASIETITHVVTITAVETVEATTTSNLESTTTSSTSRQLPSSVGIDIEEYVEDLLKWEPPTTEDGHWPPYEYYRDKNYDPNRWEGFELERGYYVNAGVNQLQQSQSKSEDTAFPYPDYNSTEWRRKWKGDFVPCDGPAGRPVEEGQGDLPRAYGAVSDHMPLSFSGSAEAVGLSSEICLDRTQRYGPYGLNSRQTSPSSGIEWKDAHWGALQNECVQKNKERWAPDARQLPKMTPDFNDPVQEVMDISRVRDEMIRRHSSESENSQPQYQARTAILIRTWEGYDYAENDIMAIRSMVTELSLATGGEYQVFLFVNVKDQSQAIFTDEEVYKKVLDKHVPEELRDIAILWNENVCQVMYPNVTDWQVYWHQFMSVQWFSEMHPEFDYIWNWEMDVRYIGNHYSFLSKLGDFARKQPRKYLWERNARYYIPGFHGRNYSAFAEASNKIIAEAAAADDIEEPIWGPRPYSSEQKPRGPSAPWPQEDDDFSWGVGEDADLITLLPIWDPEKTWWTMRNKIWNFTPGIHPVFNEEHPTDDDHDHPSYREIPRRAYINTVIRLSRRLLHSMHAENLAGRTMQAEMWPTTVALHHGFKAVYAPHPIYSGVKWPARYADHVFNADGGIPARWGQEIDSVYNQDREVNFRPFSWYYHAEFPKVLWRRWMGWQASDDAFGEVGGTTWEETGGNNGPLGRMCLPPMLLHPIKRNELDDD